MRRESNDRFKILRELQSSQWTSAMPPFCRSIRKPRRSWLSAATTASCLIAAALLFPSANADIPTNDNPLHLQGHKKKKTSSGKVFASYGLSPVAATPKRSIQYSQAAVRAASTSSSSTRSHGGDSTTTASDHYHQQPPAPGCPHAKIDLRPYMTTVEDQSESNSCAANAVAGAYEYLATRAALRDGEDAVGDISRLFIYYVGRKRDQVNWGKAGDDKKKPTDGGMTLQGAIEAVQLKGAALQASWPFDLERVNHKPHADAFGEAMRYKVGDAMQIPLDLDRMRQCLCDGYPIIFGLKLTLAFFRPPSDGFIPTPDPTDPQAAEHGLHAMLIVGFNDRQRVFIVRNSWGAQWGVDGYAYLAYDYVVNENFNCVGMFAIQSLTDDDLTPDVDDGTDMVQNDDEANNDTIEDVIEDFLEELFGGDDDGEEEEEEDWDDMFDSKAEALRAFTSFAGNHGDLASHNLLLDRSELKAALKGMGVPMVSDEEIELAFARYDDDRSGFLSFDEFYDMQSFFAGTLLERKDRLLHQVESSICHYAKQSFGNWLPQLPGIADMASKMVCDSASNVMSTWKIPSQFQWLSDLSANILFPEEKVAAGNGEL